MLDGRLAPDGAASTAAGALPRVALPPGAVVLPAFVDEHLHLFATLAARTGVDLSAARSLPEVLARLADACALARREPAAGRAVRAWGIDEFDLAERRLPTVAELDAVGGDVAIELHHRTGHAVLRTTRPPPAGPDRDRDERRWAALTTEATRLSGELAALGVVELCDTSDGNDAGDLRALAALGLAQRLRAMVGIAAVASAGAAAATAGAAAAVGIGIEAVKVMPPRCGLDRVAEQQARAHAAGFAAAVHAVDVDELQAALDGDLQRGDRIEHAGLCLPEQVGALAARGATVVTQPTFVTRRARKYRAALSEVERGWLYRVRSLLDAGIAVRFSSDSPVVPPGPLEQVAAAAGRRLGTNERVGVAAGLAAVCRPAAVGDPADLVVLAEDPLALERAGAGPEAVGRIEVLATWRAGELLHGDPRRWPSAPAGGARR